MELNQMCFPVRGSTPEEEEEETKLLESIGQYWSLTNGVQRSSCHFHGSIRKPFDMVAPLRGKERRESMRRYRKKEKD
jgi:hypothetical protein